MGADREKNQDMAQAAQGDTAHSDITFLLAGAADGVEIGTAPYQAVVRGGRRRRARRWAVATAAALALAASTGTLALAGIGGGDGDRVTPATQPTAQPQSPAERRMYTPLWSTLASGTDRGREWWVDIGIWAAPRNEAEAKRQISAMAERGLTPSDARTPKELVGKASFFLKRDFDGVKSPLMLGEIGKESDMSGKDIQSVAVPLEPDVSGDTDTRNRLVIGQVAPTARAVTCTWDDGTTTVARKVPYSTTDNIEKPAIRSVPGSKTAWFVCLAGEGREYKSVKVSG
ncbi:hypothetical protein ACKI1I_26950 [Streptomyces turgidiscabies]|nr:MULTISPECIES: hypothetical protein [Streptomyces]MDX3494308.1 hypothetical protein [Streptomyces turgidiscabies]GAQ68318.1 hypothetical protein T45_00028 [Streptomyces turgidiscabies]